MNFKTTYAMTDEVLDKIHDAEAKTGMDEMDLIMHVVTSRYAAVLF